MAAAVGLQAQTSSGSYASQPKGKETSLADLRVRTSLNAAWRFKRQMAPGAAMEPEFVGAEQPGYDDSSWATVVLPHTWDATPESPFVIAGHFRGLGWYRRLFDVPLAWKGNRVWVDFKGVYLIADVWVNGHHAGRHVGGYTGFTYDITDFLTWGAPNLLAVKVNDVLSPFIAPATEVNVAGYGGIYRSVALVVTDPLHIRPNGTWVTTERSGDAATIRIRSWINNAGRAPVTARLETTVLDAGNRTVTSLEANAVVTPGEAREFDQRAEPISDPHLWWPENPYLYRVVTTVWDGTRVADRYVTPFGIRFMGYDPSKGFTLNGQWINLHGVDRRQDYGFLGDAVPEAVSVRDVRLMKEMGINFMRTAHYPQDPTVLDACDQQGILIWEEIPDIKWYRYPLESYSSVRRGLSAHDERFAYPYLENLKQQLHEMIERDRNHPSIIIWGLGDDLEVYHYPQDFADLSNAAHAQDPTRWTAGRVPHVTDILPTDEPNLIEQHREHPERKYIWNEWGAFVSERGREGLPATKTKPFDPEEVAIGDSDAAVLTEGELMQWRALPWLGTAKWVMFDTGEPNMVFSRSLGEEVPDDKVMVRWPFSDYMGAADMWRLPKERYYLLQSQWTEKPMIHVVGHWTRRGQAGQERTVRVYSNCDTAELFLNGRSLGVHKPASNERVWQDFRRLIDSYQITEDWWRDQIKPGRLPGATLAHPPLIWDNVPYENGRLEVVGQKGGTTVRDEARTPGSPVRIAVKSEKATLMVGREDVSFIEADVVDANGVTVADANPWIHFSVEGPGRLLGGATVIDAISGVAAINVQTSGQPGELVVTATAEGLEPGSVQIQCEKD